MANVSYELTFAIVGLALFAFMKWKRVRFELPKQGDKLIAAVCETAGQLTYVYAMSGNGAIAAPILSSVCVVSLILSRIFLKEKLTKKQYLFIGIIIVGILMLAVIVLARTLMLKPTAAASAVVELDKTERAVLYGDKLAKMIPMELHITIKKALEQNRELASLYETDETTKKILDIAVGLEGLPRQASTHACRSSYNKRPSVRLCATICK